MLHVLIFNIVVYLKDHNTSVIQGKPILLPVVHSVLKVIGLMRSHRAVITQRLNICTAPHRFNIAHFQPAASVELISGLQCPIYCQ